MGGRERLAVCCAVWAVLLGATASAQEAGPAVRMGQPTVQTLVADLDRTVVRVDFPVSAAPADWDSIDPAAIRWWRPTDDGPPRAGFGIALPGGAADAWRVDSVRWWRNPDREVSPDELISVIAPAIHRDVALGGVQVVSTVDGGVLAGVVVTVEHRPSDALSGKLAQVRGDPRLQAAARREAPAFALVNGEVFRQLRSAAMLTAATKAARAPVPDWFALTDHWVRVEITTEGVHTINGLDLAGWGVSPGDVDPAKLRLYRGGGFTLEVDPTVPDEAQADRMGLVEVAIAVEDGGDGSWDSNDRLVFYGFGADVWTDRLDPTAAVLDHQEHPYADHGVYWLTWEGFGDSSPLPGDPRRIATVAAATQAGAPPITMQWARYHGEESLAPAPGVVRDNWVWEKFILGSEYQAPVTLETTANDQAASFVVDVRSENRGAAEMLVTAWFNNDSAAADTLRFKPTDQRDSLRVRLFGETTALRSGYNVLRVKNAATSDPLMLDSFDLRYRQALDKRLVGGALWCHHWADEVAAPGTAVNLEVSLDASAQPRVWDISRADSVFALTGDFATGSPSRLTLGLMRDPATSRHLVVFDDDDLETVTGRRVTVTPLRRDVVAADYVVLYHPQFADAAADLAALRSRTLPGVEDPRALSISVDDVYANFSGGNKDPLALRNFLRWFYNLSGQRLRFACFLGDASRDYRNYLGVDPDGPAFDYVPSWLQIGNFPNELLREYSTDDHLVSFDAPPPPRRYDAPDLATGRLTVTRPAEARRLVDLIANMSETPEDGLWRNRIVFSADDQYQGEPPYNYDTFRHLQQSEWLAHNFVPASIDLEKINLCDYDFVGLYKPTARADLIGRLNSGATIFYYVGHGSTAQLADEQLFLLGDIPNLSNQERRFLFCAFSCKVGVYDDPGTRSMSEVFITSENGGAIAAVAASQDSYIGPNNALSDAFFGSLYPGRHVDADSTLGDALLRAKLAVWYTGDTDYSNGRRYLLFGDPALRLPNPVDDLEFAAGSADTLQTGQHHTVGLDLAAHGLQGAGMDYNLRVEESNRLVEEKFVYPNGFTIRDSWVRRGGTVFRGTGPAAGQALEVPFLAPLQMRYGEGGRLRLLVRDGREERVAILDSVPVVLRSAGVGDDIVGPSIELGVLGIRNEVRPLTDLTANVADTSGINILGSNPANSVLLEFDGTGIYTDVTERFLFEPGSYTTGALRAPLPADLEPGEHEMVLLASDMVGNVGSDTLSFTLVGRAGPDFGAVILFPNPTQGPCRLVCELSDAMTLQWDIYTVSGRRVRSVRRAFSSGGRVTLEWDGRDGEGDHIANGTYLYVLRGAGDSGAGHEVRRTGQLVIMR